MENERADAGRDSRTRLATPNSQVRTGTGMMSLLVESLHMRRSWPQYICVTPQRTALILPCLAVLPPLVFSIVVSPVLIWFWYVFGIRCLCTEGAQ